MGDLKARIKAKFLRRHSGVSSLGSGKQSLGRDRTSSSTHTTHTTHTHSSATGYAASISTTAGDEHENHNEKENENRHGKVTHLLKDRSAKDKPGHGHGHGHDIVKSIKRSTSSAFRYRQVDNNNGKGGVDVVIVAPSCSSPGDGPTRTATHANQNQSLDDDLPSQQQHDLVLVEVEAQAQVQVQVEDQSQEQRDQEKNQNQEQEQEQDQDQDQNQNQNQNRDRAETVPPELLEQLDLVSNSNNIHENENVNNLPPSLPSLLPSLPLPSPTYPATYPAYPASPAFSISSTTPASPISPTTITTATNITKKSKSKFGKDLQNPALNSTTIPTITKPSSLDIQTPEKINNDVLQPSLLLPPPLPSINEDSLLQRLKNHEDGLSDYLPSPASASRALSPSSSLSRPGAPPRRQSILPNRQTTLIKALLHTGYANDVASPEPDSLLPISGNMVTRKIWVKRPLASPTLITINEDDLVDDVRDLILRKYANSLGRQYDAPDLTLRICDREQQTTRPLQPDEPMGRTLDAYYPGGQSVDDALLIDIPSRRTPKASPNPRYYGDDRPHESATDYFPPYPPIPQHPTSSSTTVTTGPHQLHFPPSLTVISGGQLPPLPSPGGTRRLGSSRPKIQRMHTASPVSTATNGHGSQTGAPPIGMHNYPRQPRSRTHSGASSEQSNHPPVAPSIPTPPIPERTATPPPPRVSSPRPVQRPKKNKKTIDHPSLPPGMLNGGVPPINVLIVEDNIINLKLLEAFVKRLKVRWQTAMNGREAVNKWRAGGFHLVLMDIQLPVMSGLEATREIRRIEKVNSIGVFSSSASSPPDEVKAEPAEEDKLVNTEMFKSPVIIVALTASSLQSDRHEALAAGCNDFLTKPVNFVWLERKVMEWGCMQALIDFDGWRKWKDFSQKTEVDDSKKAVANKGSKMPKKGRFSMAAAA